MSRPTRRRVAIAFPPTSAVLEEILRGIAAYARQHGHWVFVGSPEPDSLNVSIENLRGWDGDGIIATLLSAREVQFAQRMRAHVVNVSGALKSAGVPRVFSDYAACGQLAAEHFLERGFTRFVFYGLRKIWFSHEMGRGFAERLRQYGFDCDCMEVPSILGSRRPWRQSGFELQNWLKTLDTPVGLLATSDSRARLVLEACQRMGLRVPEQVAIIGVNNDQLICNFCQPPLTTVARNGERIGWEAAEMLDRLMSRQPVLNLDVCVPPERIVARGSTETTAISEPTVAEAARHIQDLAAQPVGIDEIVASLPRSRRWLEQRFRELLHMSPHEFLCRTRVKLAQELLVLPSKPLFKQIAIKCGFNDTRRLRIIFERCAGMTPAEYRRRHLATLRPHRP